jgi:NAD(P)-dependent dehydrogenase (short-subunit alcohol dehydrogenase family)
MDLKLAGKTALITGGSKGIGRATAEVLVEEGCNVVIVSRSDEALNVAKADLIGRGSGRVDVLAADLARSESVDLLVRSYPDVDILVNNAGAIPGGTLLDVDENTWRTAWDLKVFGYINMCRAYYARMKSRKDGVIINVIGNSADTRDPNYICGVTGNAALTAFSRSLGSVSVREGVRIVALNPGPVETDRIIATMKRRAHDRTGDEGNWRELQQALPFGRFATPREIGAAIAFLASPHSGYTSGSVVTIDAGLSARATAF